MRFGYDLPFLVKKANYRNLLGKRKFVKSNNGRKYQQCNSLNILPHVIFLDYQVLLPLSIAPGDMANVNNFPLNFYTNKILGMSKVDCSIEDQRKFYRSGTCVDEKLIYDIYDYAINDVLLLHRMTLKAEPIGILKEMSKMFGSCLGIDLLESDKTVIYWGIFKRYLENGIILPYNPSVEPLIKHQGATNFQPESTKETLIQFYDFVSSFDVSGMYPSHGIGLNIGPETFHSITDEPIELEGINSIYFEDENYGKKYINIYKRTFKHSILCQVWEGFIKQKKECKKSGNIVGEKANKLLANSIYGILNATGVRLSFSPFAMLICYKARQTLIKARDTLNQLNPGCCVFGNTDSVHIVYSKLTNDFKQFLDKQYAQTNICTQIQRYLDDLTLEVTQCYDGVRWEFENMYTRVIYPPGLKNKYITFGIVDEEGSTFIHKLNKVDFDHFTSQGKVFISLQTLKTYLNNFAQYCEEHKFIYDQKVYKYDFCIKGLSTAKLPPRQLQTVTNYFYALACIQDLEHNKNQIFDIYQDSLYTRFEETVSRQEIEELQNWAKFEKHTTKSEIVKQLREQREQLKHDFYTNKDFATSLLAYQHLYELNNVFYFPVIGGK